MHMKQMYHVLVVFLRTALRNILAHKLNLYFIFTVILWSSHAKVVRTTNEEILESPGLNSKSLGRDEKFTYFDNSLMYPEDPIIGVMNDEPLLSDQELIAVCASRNGKPPAEISWSLDNESLKAAVDFEEIVRDRSSVSVTSILKRNLTSDDDNKNLTCKVSHAGYPKGYLEAVHKLVVQYKPIALLPARLITKNFASNSTVDISISFRANPKPSRLIWQVNDRKIYYLAKTDKFTSKEVIADGNNFWKARLTVFNFTLQDTLSSYNLIARNSLGETEYRVVFEGEKLM